MADPMVSTQELETSEHQREIRVETRCERFGWGVVVLLLVAALLGLLGRGPLSHRELSTADGALKVEYSLIERCEAPAELRILIHPPRFEGGAIRLGISRDFVERITPESVSPTPAGVETIGDQLVYTFPMRDIQQVGGRVVARFQNDDFGKLEYDISLDGHDSLHVTQYVLP